MEQLAQQDQSKSSSSNYLKMLFKPAKKPRKLRKVKDSIASGAALSVENFISNSNDQVKQSNLTKECKGSMKEEKIPELNNNPDCENRQATPSSGVSDQQMHKYPGKVHIESIDFDDLDLDTPKPNSMCENPSEAINNCSMDLFETKCASKQEPSTFHEQLFESLDLTNELYTGISEDFESIDSIFACLSNCPESTTRPFDITENVAKEDRTNSTVNQLQDQPPFQSNETPDFSNLLPGFESLFANCCQRKSWQQSSPLPQFLGINASSQLPTSENNPLPQLNANLVDQTGNLGHNLSSVPEVMNVNTRESVSMTHVDPASVYGNRNQHQLLGDNPADKAEYTLPYNNFCCFSDSHEQRQMSNITQSIFDQKHHTDSRTSYMENFSGQRFQYSSSAAFPVAPFYHQFQNETFGEASVKHRPLDGFTYFDHQRNSFNHNSLKSTEYPLPITENSVGYRLNPKEFDSSLYAPRSNLQDNSKLNQKKTFLESELTTSSVSQNNSDQQSGLPEVSANRPQKEDSVTQDKYLVSGGSIERVFSPFLPNQNTAMNFPTISIPFNEAFLIQGNTNNQSQVDMSEPDFKIHLVQTPPPLVVTNQKNDPPKKEPPFRAAMPSTMSKSKRTRRTRAEMVALRNEKAKKRDFSTYTDFSRSMNQHFNANDFCEKRKTAHHLYGEDIFRQAKRNRSSHFSMEPEKFPIEMPINGTQQELFSRNASASEPKLHHQKWTEQTSKFLQAQHEQDALKIFHNEALKQQQGFSASHTSDLSVRTYEEKPQCLASNLQQDVSNIIPTLRPFVSTSNIEKAASQGHQGSNDLHKHWSQTRSSTLNSPQEAKIPNTEVLKVPQPVQHHYHHQTENVLKNLCSKNCFCQYEHQIYAITQKNQKFELKSLQNQTSQKPALPVQEYQYPGPSCQVDCSKDRRPPKAQIIPHLEQWLPPTPPTPPSYENNFRYTNAK